MKREGRQHGMVRTCGVLPSPWNPRPHARILNKLDAPPTSGIFTKVSTKPTNHSKGGKSCKKPCGTPCTECYHDDSYPVCYSYDYRCRYRGKNKGTQKLISRDLVSVSNYKSLTWKAVEGRPGGNYSGFSATGILNVLDNQYAYDEEEENDDNVDDVTNDYDAKRGDVLMEHFWPQTGRDGVLDGDVNEEEVTIVSFIDVGMMFQLVEGDEGWYMVGEDLIVT
ncbi:uncharacterized protein LOC123224397 [Mangifera indica]|uniref:uncharacterized protein LOC123224397 n=1 Tax=Mangifera indica TaxID=29780 RepID=UPI001CFA1899|nr:uncharacterized protein LOC123224397 [Mangifera indica]